MRYVLAERGQEFEQPAELNIAGAARAPQPHLAPSCPGKSAKRVFALDDPGIHDEAPQTQAYQGICINASWIAGA